jgi:hypothetical protein
MLPRDHLVHIAAKHEDRECFRDTRQLGSRVPSLEAEEREDSDNGPATDYARERSESILDDERA